MYMKSTKEKLTSTSNSLPIFFSVYISLVTTFWGKLDTTIKHLSKIILLKNIHYKMERKAPFCYLKIKQLVTASYECEQRYTSDQSSTPVSWALHLQFPNIWFRHPQQIQNLQNQHQSEPRTIRITFTGPIAVVALIEKPTCALSNGIGNYRLCWLIWPSQLVVHLLMPPFDSLWCSRFILAARSAIHIPIWLNRFVLSSRAWRCKYSPFAFRLEQDFSISPCIRAAAIWYLYWLCSSCYKRAFK